MRYVWISLFYIVAALGFGLGTFNAEVYPVAGIIGTDIRPVLNYFDHDSWKATTRDKNGMGNNNIRDYMRGLRTYDGHEGTDFSLVSFDWQDIGVPVVTVADGVVIETEDGHDDRNTAFVKTPGNYVMIDHGDGIITYYNHLRKGSVSVKIGERVYAGQQIGLVGSSGRSLGPHLHFGYKVDGVWKDPFSIDDNEKSIWKNPPPYNPETIIGDWGLAYKDDINRIPYSPPRETYAKRGDSKSRDMKLWFDVLNVPATVYSRTFKLYAPSGKLINTYNDTLDGSESWHGLGSEHWRYWYGTRFSEKASIGVWKIEIFFNEKLMKIVSFYVGDEEPLNSPPLACEGISFFPPDFKQDDVLSVRIEAALQTLDPELQRERYRYIWSVNGEVVRTSTQVTRLDYLPKIYYKKGDFVEVSVECGDGELWSDPVIKEITVK